MERLRESRGSGLAWNCLFVLPFWLQTVWRHLGVRGEPCILSVADGSRIIGIVPLAIDGHTAYFSGNPDVCDYQDIIAVPEQASVVMAAVASYLKAEGVKGMDLKSLHPDALTLNAMHTLEHQENWNPRIEPDEVTFKTSLPSTWDAYLMQLTGKQRHEVRRKMRRLENSGDFALTLAGEKEDLTEAIDRFLRLFHMNRADKSEFMDDTMSAYFRELIQALADRQMLRLYFLEIAGNPTATVLCFDYNQVRYLYNSGYDAHYYDFSVGILSKLLSIRSGIDNGCQHYDFLKGAETYKKHLGGHEVQLYRCRLEF